LKQTERSSQRVQCGAGMIETMVGVLIGLIVVVVIYNLLAVTEGYRRVTEGASDAQITGLVSQLMVGREIANGGNGISVSASDPTSNTGLITATPPRRTSGRRGLSTDCGGRFRS
jgi:Tfp pilus assembly protein PilW